MTGFQWFSKNLCVVVLWMKVASALEGLMIITWRQKSGHVFPPGDEVEVAVTFLQPGFSRSPESQQSVCSDCPASSPVSNPAL